MRSKATKLLFLRLEQWFPSIISFNKYFHLFIISLLLFSLYILCYLYIQQIPVLSKNVNSVYKVVNVSVSGGGQPLMLPSGADPNATVRAQRDFVKDMMRQSWDSYVKYAWGWNELSPVSQMGRSEEIFGGDTRLGATIVDALDTLYIMNMTEEFNAGREWVAKEFDFTRVSGHVSVFETVIRFVGGLLASYALSNDPMFLQKARHVADLLLPAFDTPTGLPLGLIKPQTGQSWNDGWPFKSESSLAGVGSLHLEFVYLSYATGDQKYSKKVIKIREFLDKIPKPLDGLYFLTLNPYYGQWGKEEISVGAMADSFYEYLIKSWLQTNGTDLMARRMYDSAVDAIDRHLVQRSKQSGLTYLAKMIYGEELEHEMHHLACFAGGMFALGAQNQTNLKKKQHFAQLGANITDTCAQSYLRTVTRLGPESFHFTERYEAMALNDDEKHYLLRPEVIESYFYLWRLTHDQRFRDYAWSAAQAIGQHCRTGSGFSGISNVYDLHHIKDDIQQTFFLSETLKYLYLIFSSDDLISINDWVLNTEAHPFPILSAQSIPQQIHLRS